MSEPMTSQYETVKAAFERARRHILEKSLIRDVSPARRARLRPNRRLTRTLARAFPRKCIIEVGKTLLDIPQDQETLFQLMLHELCHLVAPLGAGHGPEFKRRCREAGCRMDGATAKGFAVKRSCDPQDEGLPSWCFPPTPRRTQAFLCSDCNKISWTTEQQAEKIKIRGGYCRKCRSVVFPMTDAWVERVRRRLRREEAKKKEEETGK